MKKASPLFKWQIEKNELEGLFSVSNGAKNYFIGYDEAGRGAWVGPVSCAAVSFSSPILEQIQKRKLLPLLDDSKKMSENLRLEYFHEIKKLADYYAIFLISEKDIDNIGINPSIEKGFLNCYKECKSAGLNLKKSYHFIDGNYKFHSVGWKSFRSETAYSSSFVKGDSRFCVIAAASVLAKVERDNFLIELDKKYPEYGWINNKGYGTKQHREALGKFGFKEVHRKSYKPIQKLIQPQK